MQQNKLLSRRKKSFVLVESVNRKNLLFFLALAAQTSELATPNSLVEFFLKWVWAFFDTKAK
jgi:hypothetical protein